MSLKLSSILSAAFLCTALTPAHAQFQITWDVSSSSSAPAPALPRIDGKELSAPIQAQLPSGITSAGTSVSQNRRALSADGSVIVGSVFEKLDGQLNLFKRFGQSRPTFWNLDGAGTIIDFGGVFDEYVGQAVAVSADGTVIAGQVQEISEETVDIFQKTFATRDAVAPTETQTRTVIGPQKAFRWTKADGITFLGTLKDDNSGYSNVAGISRDGTTIIGQSERLVPLREVSDPNDRIATRGQAFVWTKEKGMVAIGTLRANDSGDSYAKDVSDDGSVVVGMAQIDDAACTVCQYHGDRYQGFVFKDGQISALPGLAEIPAMFLPFTDANAVSGDGKIIAGRSSYLQPGQDIAYLQNNDATGLKTQAVIWENGQARALGFLTTAPSTSSATLISRDGKVVVGESNTDFQRQNVTYNYKYSPQQAFRWDAGTGIETLGSLRAAGDGYTKATGLSADGRVIVGHGETDIELTFVAKPVDTGTVAPATLRTTRDMKRNVTRGFVWTRETGMQEVGTLRDKDNHGSSAVTGVSDDGTVIVGQSHTNDSTLSPYDNEGTPNDSETFIMRLLPESEDGSTTPTRLGPMLSLPNTQRQIGQSGQNQANGLGTLSGNLASTGDGELSVGQQGTGDFETRVSTQGKMPRRLPFAINFTASQTRSGAGIEQTNALLRAATKVGNLTFGGFVQAGRQSQGTPTFDFLSTTPSAGFFIRGGDRYGQGLTWKLSYSAIKGEARITRDAGFANTEIGVGTADVSASALGLELGYGHKLGRTDMNSFVRLNRTDAKRGAFTETAGATFPISFDEYAMQSTSLSVGTTARFNVSPRSIFSLGIAIEKDINTSNNPITGQSAIPGFTNFAVAGPAVVNDIRTSVSASYEYSFNSGSSVVVGAYAGQTRFSNKIASGISVGFTQRW